MSNRITVNVDDPDGLLSGLGAGALIRLQSAATQAGAYSDVTTIAIVAADHEYVYEHLSGLDTTWYRVRFEDAAGNFPKDYGAPFQVNDVTSAYATGAAFRTYIRSSGIDADAFTEKLALESAARAIDRVCGRTFRLATGTATARVFTATYSTAPSGWYWRRFAVEVDDFFDVTGLVVKFDATGNGSYTTASTSYRVQPTNAPVRGLPYTALVFDLGVIPPLHAEGIQLTANWGWPAYPSAVVNANLVQAARFVKRRDSPYGVAGSPEMGNEMRLLAKLDPDVAVMLQPYKLDWGIQ